MIKKLFLALIFVPSLAFATFDKDYACRFTVELIQEMIDSRDSGITLQEYNLHLYKLRNTGQITAEGLSIYTNLAREIYIDPNFILTPSRAQIIYNKCIESN